MITWRPVKRHRLVVARPLAAVAAKAQYIVTHNLRDFAGVEAFGLEAITPAQMLVKLSKTS